MTKTLEELAGNLLAVWKKYDIKPKGPMLSLHDNVMKIGWNPHLSFNTCLTYQKFMQMQNTDHQVSHQEMFVWYHAMELRYSSSSICTILLRGITPMLMGNTKFSVDDTQEAKVVDLKGAKAFYVYFIANNSKRIFDFGYVREAVEAEDLEGVQVGCVPHNFLLLSDGSILDFTIAQFTGNVHEGKWFESIESYLIEIPGRVTMYGECTEECISQQMTRDISVVACWECKTMNKFVTEVIDELQSGWEGFCRNCFSFAKDLKRCMG